MLCNALRRTTPVAAPLRQSVRAFGAEGTGRAHVKPSGGKVNQEDNEYVHWPKYDDLNVGAHSRLITERGRVWSVNENNHRHLRKMFPFLNQDDLPFFGFRKLSKYGNYDYLMNVEYLFFYIPAFLVLGLCIPGFACLYAGEDCIHSEMVVKVTGRQWYWVYEVESPTDDDEEGEDDD